MGTNMDEASKYSQMEIAMRDYMLMESRKAMGHIHGETVQSTKANLKMELDLDMGHGLLAARTTKATTLMTSAMDKECTSGETKAIIKDNS